MDRLTFQVEETPQSPLRTHQAAPYINGKRLTSLLGLIWTPPGEAEPHEHNIGLAPSMVFLPSRHFLDPEPQNPAASGDGTIILGCSCGVDDCTYVHARIDVGEQFVRWSDFGYWPGGGPVGATFRSIRDLSFDRTEYEEALSGPSQSASA